MLIRSFHNEYPIHLPLLKYLGPGPHMVCEKCFVILTEQCSITSTTPWIVGTNLFVHSQQHHCQPITSQSPQVVIPPSPSQLSPSLYASSACSSEMLPLSSPVRHVNNILPPPPVPLPPQVSSPAYTGTSDRLSSLYDPPFSKKPSSWIPEPYPDSDEHHPPTLQERNLWRPKGHPNDVDGSPWSHGPESHCRPIESPIVEENPWRPSSIRTSPYVSGRRKRNPHPSSPTPYERRPNTAVPSPSLSDHHPQPVSERCPSNTEPIIFDKRRKSMPQSPRPGHQFDSSSHRLFPKPIVDKTSSYSPTPNPASVLRHPYPDSVSRHPYPDSMPGHPYPNSVPRHPYPDSVPRHPYPDSVPRHPYPDSVPRHPLPDSVP